MLDSLPFLGIDFIGCTGACNVTAIGNLFKFGQLLEARITFEIEDEEVR